MTLLRGSLLQQVADAICLTTNGAVKGTGQAVMGRGCAREAAHRWPALPQRLGDLLRASGNRVHLLTIPGPDGPSLASHGPLPFHLLSFPVKPVAAICTGTNVVPHLAAQWSVGETIPGWACKADLSIIRQSAEELVALTTTMRWARVVLPRPGCGAGALDWTTVEPLLQGILDDRFQVISFPSSVYSPFLPVSTHA